MSPRSPRRRSPRPPRTANRFRERELARALRAAKSAGVGERVEIDPVTGKISVFIAKPGGGQVSDNDLDNWLKKRERNAPQT